MSTADLTSILQGDVCAEIARARLRLNATDAPPLPLKSLLRHRSADEVIADPKIMIVDDEPINVKVVHRYLSSQGYRDLVATTDSTEAVAIVEKEQPDVVLLDIMMPDVSGLEILDCLRKNEQFVDLPIIILTADTNPNTKMEALRLGATDFLTKPADCAELVARVRNVLLAKANQDRLKNVVWELELNNSACATEMAAIRQEIIGCLARAAEHQYDPTGRHVVRVGLVAGIIARQLGLHEDPASVIAEAAPLHDVGLIHLPDAALLGADRFRQLEFEATHDGPTRGNSSSGAVSADDRRVFQSHPELGARILGGGAPPLLKTAARIALTHHESFDGTGYPLGLAGKDIPVEGRIVAVANAFDGLAGERSGRPSSSFDECSSTLQEAGGTYFDPEVLEAFVACKDQIVQIWEENRVTE